MTTHHLGKKTSLLRFNDYIRLLPSAWLFAHFLERSSSQRKILSSSAIHDRISRFSQEETLTRRFTTLEPQLQYQCALTYLLGATGLPTPSSTVDLNDPLVQSFLVYAARNNRGETRYFGFTEFEPLLRPLLAERLAKDSIVKTKPLPSVSRQVYCLNDLAVIGVLASQGLLEKKRQGGLMQVSSLKIARLLQETSISQESSDCTDLLMAYGKHAGLLLETEDRYWLLDREFEKWLTRPVKECKAELIGFAVEFAGSWRLDLLRELFSTIRGSYLSCTMFPEKIRKDALRSLKLLCWTGLVELARGEAAFGEPRARESTTGSTAGGENANAGVVVMPNFSVVIPQEASPEQLFRFGRVGSLQSLDRVYKGAIDRAIINDSLAGGLDGETILGWLMEWRAPSNVMTTVREWNREFYRLYITDGPMLITTDDKVAFEIGAHQPLREYLEPVPSRAVFRINRGGEAVVKELLAAMGFDYRMPGHDRTALEPETGKASPGSREVWEPVANEAGKGPGVVVQLRGKKYGAGLKSLDLNETMHIIEYALLTAQELTFEYAGSSLIRKGLYSVTPRSCGKGAEPLLEATLKGGQKKQFHVRKINKIGVGPS